MNIEDELREKLLIAQSTIFSLKAENNRLRLKLEESDDLSTPRSRVSPYKRKKILDITEGRCFFCNCKLRKDTYTVEHLIPRSRGGNGLISNLVPSCEPCNLKKGDNEASPTDIMRAHLLHVKAGNFALFR